MNGKEKALKAFNKPDGKFVKGEMYVFAYDLNAVMMAHPVNPKLVGKSLLNEADSAKKTLKTSPPPSPPPSEGEG